MADINDKYVLYYAVRGYASGEIVALDIYDTIGVKEVDTGSMTELVSGLGIYYYNWFPKKRTTYIAVMNCAAKPRQVHDIIRIEKTKLAGAVTIPRAPIFFTSKVKDDMFKSLLNINGVQKDIIKNQGIMSTKISKNTKELSTQIPKVIISAEKSVELTQANLNKFTKEIDNKLIAHKSESFSLLNDGVSKLRETNELNLNQHHSTIEKALGVSINDLKQTFLTEAKKFTNQDIFKKLNNLAKCISDFSFVTDEVSTNLKLSNEIFNSKFKSRLEALCSNADELILLIKNANSNSSNGPSGKEETLQVCAPGTY